jgi:hypothetical protein
VFEQFRHLGDDLCLMLSARDIGSPCKSGAGLVMKPLMECALVNPRLGGKDRFLSG